MLPDRGVRRTADDTTPGDGLVTLREAVLAAESDGTTDLAETGSGAGLGGAIYSQGVLRISASTLTGNRAIGGSGGPGADNAGNDSGGGGFLDPAVEECDDGNLADGDGCSTTCEIRCAPAPLASCVAAAKGSVGLDERKPGKEKLKASLKKFGSDVIQADFGDPVGGATRFAACLYDGSDTLALDLRVDRAGALCGPKQKPCWKALSTKGYAYKDPLAEAEGVAKITAKGGSAGKGSLTVEGRNKAKKGLTQLPTGAAAALQGATSATLQVLASDGACFSVPLTTVKKADGAQFKAKAP
jgi:cysteine-rich repeat protein